MNVSSTSMRLLLMAVTIALGLAACGNPVLYGPHTGPVTREGLSLAWSPDGEWIVFPSSQDQGPPELYALNVDDALAGAGRELWIHLSQGFADALDPGDLDPITYDHLAWSPDGQQIAFTAGDTVYTFDAACLGAPNICADSLSLIVDGASAWLTLAWSPDSGRLLTESTTATTAPLVKMPGGWGAGELVRHMRVVATDGSGEVLLSRETPPRQAPDWVEYVPFSPVWSPDGQRILYASGRDGEADIYAITLDGEEVVQLTDTPDVSEYSPGWSPDGNAMTYVADSAAGHDAYRQDLHSGAVTCATCDVHPSWDYSLLWTAWSPDDSRLVYGVTGRPRLFQRALPYYLYLVAPYGSDQVPIIEEGFPGPPFWSPDGTRLAFGFRPRNPLESTESDIFIVNPDGTGLTNITD